MVEQRIKPYAEKELGTAHRERQTREFRRNQVLGLLILAAAIVVFWLIRAPRGWAFPAGWWRW